MAAKMGRMGFLARIQNRHFQKLFFKNWLSVFAGIIVPLILSVGIVFMNAL